MVSKFKTVEKTAAEILVMLAMVFGVALASGFSSNVQAKDDDNKSSNGNSPSISDARETCKDAQFRNPNETAAACLERLLKKASGGGTKEGCDKAWDDYDKASTEAAEKCGAAGIPSNSKSGFPACAGAIDKCSCVDQPDDAKCADTSDFSEEMESPRSDGGSGVDLNLEAKKLKFCPAMSAADLKDFKEEVAKSQEKVDELENKLPELQDSIDSVQSDLSTKLSDLEEQKKEAQKEYNNGKKELERSKKDNIKALEDKISGVQDQIFKIEADIRTALLSKSEVSLKRDESIKSIKLSCHSVATQEASARRMKIFSEIKAGTYRKGGFLTALKSVGLSDRKEDQQFAEKLYKNCLNSKQTKEAIDSANKMASLSLTQIDGTILSLQKQAGQLKDSITKIKNQEGGCANNSPSAQSSSEMCRVLTEFQEDRIQLDQEALQNATKIGNDIIRAQQDAARTLATKQEALALGTQQLERERAYLEDKRRALALKLQAGGASSASAEKVAEAYGKVDVLRSVITRLKTTCCSGDIENEDPRCNEVKSYYDSFNPDETRAEQALDENASETESQSGSTGKEVGSLNSSEKTKTSTKAQGKPPKVNSEAKTDRLDIGIREGTTRPQSP